MDISKSNFAAQCSAHLRSESRYYKEGAVWQLQAERLESAVHFVVPENGALLDDDLRGLATTENLRLPFPSITTEFAVNTESGSWPLVALAEESAPTSDGVVSITVHVFVSAPAPLKWCPSVACMRVQSDEWNKSGEYGTWFSQAFYDSMPSDKDEHIGLRLAYLSVLELCEALTCSNVSHEVSQSAASDERNLKRARKGKFPIWEYRVLTIPVVKTSSRHTDPTGTHAGPRQHLRMGHIRRHPTAGNIWVNSCLVGKASRGVIEKTYEVRA